MAAEDYGKKFPVEGARYCEGCGTLVQIVSLENWVYRNTAKVCPKGCEQEPGVLKGTPLPPKPNVLEENDRANARLVLGSAISEYNEAKMR